MMMDSIKKILTCSQVMYNMRIRKKKSPLAISWKITNRCNGSCLYCVGSKNGPELDTGQVKYVIDQLSSGGVRFISFTGGEPLLRSDIGDIISYSRNKGIKVKLNTNGYLLRDRIDELKGVNLIQLSLDGKEEVNDLMRGRGSFKKILQGLDKAKEMGIEVFINSVLSRFNIEYLDDIFAICRSYQTGAYFQPARTNLLGGDKFNDSHPVHNEYKKCVRKLISLKKNRSHERLIRNSISGLKYLYNWPEPSHIPCYAGLVSFRLDSEGMLCNCSESRDQGISILKHGFSKALKMLDYKPCKECWCSTQVEFNLAMNLNFNTLLNYFKIGV